MPLTRLLNDKHTLIRRGMAFPGYSTNSCSLCGLVCQHRLLVGRSRVGGPASMMRGESERLRLLTTPALRSAKRGRWHSAIGLFRYAAHRDTIRHVQKTKAGNVP
jgi:hypothetical protein